MRTLTLVAAAVITTACASSSSFSSVWKNPDADPVSLTGKKVLAIVQIRDEARRRQGEDLLAAEITKRGGQGIASYTLFPSIAKQQDESAAQERAKQSGIAGIVIMQFKGVKRTMTREPNPNNL